MKRSLGFLLGMVCCVLLATSVVAAEDSAFTVGDLAVKLAKMVTDRGDYTPEGAVAVLGQVGIQLDGRLDEQVTEAYFVDAVNQMGTDLSTVNPGRILTPGDATQLFRMFDDGLPSTEAGCPPGFPANSCNSVKCKGGGPNENASCSSDADCPGGFCRVPPGIAKKVGSPSDG